MHAQDDNRCFQSLLMNSLGRLERMEQWQSYAHDHDVRIFANNYVDRLSSIPCLAEDREIRLSLEHQPQPVPHDCVIVGQHDTNGSHITKLALFSARGSST